MDVAALILAILAIICFLARRPPLPHVNWGLALLTAAIICQWVALTGDVVTVR